jgi:hypothetical protein
VDLIGSAPRATPSSEHDRRVEALFREWAAGR